MALIMALFITIFAVVLIGIAFRFTRPGSRIVSNVSVRAHDARVRLRVARSNSQIRSTTAEIHRKLVRELSDLNLPAVDNGDSTVESGTS